MGFDGIRSTIDYEILLHQGQCLAGFLGQETLVILRPVEGDEDLVVDGAADAVEAVPEPREESVPSAGGGTSRDNLPKVFDPQLNDVSPAIETKQEDIEMLGEPNHNTSVDSGVSRARVLRRADDQLLYRLGETPDRLRAEP